MDMKFKIRGAVLLWSNPVSAPPPKADFLVPESKTPTVAGGLLDYEGG